MASTDAPKKSLKEKLLHEIEEYAINVLYMAIFFSAIIFYRRQLLAEHGIFLDDYFMGVIKALIIAKVVMIGTFLPFAKKFEDHERLIVPVLYKAVVFTIWVAFFDMVEELVRGLIGTGEFSAALEEMQHHVTWTWFGALLLIFISFIPFFAYKEMGRMMGAAKLRRMFLGGSEGAGEGG